MSLFESTLYSEDKVCHRNLWHFFVNAHSVLD